MTRIYGEARWGMKKYAPCLPELLETQAMDTQLWQSHLSKVTKQNQNPNPAPQSSFQNMPDPVHFEIQNAVT